jgi:predicted  nucleic acid-binding Zn-ribbon protein
MLVAGVGGGIAALAASGSAYDEGVESLARAPVGCTTRLDFDESGTFSIYVETKGTAGDPGGDCPNNGNDYERDDDRLPDVDLVLTDEDDDPVDIEDDDGASYDAAGSAGQAIATVDIEEPGRYELTVTSDEDDFAVAVGKNPKEAADTLKLISYLLIGAGIVLGGLLILLGSRRRSRPASAGPGGSRGAPVTYYPEQQPPTAYAPSGAHTATGAPAPPDGTPPAPPPAPGGFGPPMSTPPAGPTEQTSPTRQTPAAPQWPAPPTS